MGGPYWSHSAGFSNRRALGCRRPIAAHRMTVAPPSMNTVREPRAAAKAPEIAIENGSNEKLPNMSKLKTRPCIRTGTNSLMLVCHRSPTIEGQTPLADRQDDDKRDGRRESDEDDSAILRRRERVGKEEAGQGASARCAEDGPEPGRAVGKVDAHGCGQDDLSRARLRGVQDGEEDDRHPEPRHPTNVAPAGAERSEDGCSFVRLLRQRTGGRPRDEGARASRTAAKDHPFQGHDRRWRVAAGSKRRCAAV